MLRAPQPPSCAASRSSPPAAASVAFRGTHLHYTSPRIAIGEWQRSTLSSMHRLCAATMLVSAAGAAAAGTAAVGCFPLQRAQCRAATAGAAAGFSGSVGTTPAEHFALLRITGDGRCLFRSLAQGSHLAAQGDATAGASASGSSGSGGTERETQAQPLQQPQLLSSAAETAASDELRQAICEELLQRREEIAFFIDEDFDAYVARMRRPQTWGGEPELAVAAHVLHRPVTVYMQGVEQLTLISRYGEDQYTGKHDASLFFHGAGHYDLLVRQHELQPRSHL